jgi:hypothetical protein
MLAEIAKALGDEKVNILSCLTTTSGTEGTTHLLVDNVNKAKKALADARLSYTEADVLHVELPNKPGALGKFAMKLADNNINITLGYATGGKSSKKTTLVFSVSDLDKAARIR